MKFTKNYNKLYEDSFTTIRKNTGYYKTGRIYRIVTPNEIFRAKVQSIISLKKVDIDDDLALDDADMRRGELIEMLENWYGKEFDDFVLITLARQGGLRRKENK